MYLMVQNNFNKYNYYSIIYLDLFNLDSALSTQMDYISYITALKQQMKVVAVGRRGISELSISHYI